MALQRTSRRFTVAEYHILVTSRFGRIVKSRLKPLYGRGCLDRPSRMLEPTQPRVGLLL